MGTALIFFMPSLLLAGCFDSAEAEPNDFIVLVLDSSGSMELSDDCFCESLSCNECMPDCAAGERSRWMDVVETLTGSYVEGRCTSTDRTTEEGATFDVGYYRSYGRPPLDAEQRSDGLLFEYADRAHLGVATFDGWDTYVGSPPLVDINDFDHGVSGDVDGLWSYGAPRIRPDGSVVGRLNFPGCGPINYAMDTGIRAPDAANGALTTTLGSVSMRAALGEVADVIERTRPWGGTPIAAALDDIDIYLRGDPAVVEHAGSGGARHHVILLSDGKPDDDYYKFGCDCTQSDDPDAEGFCGNASGEPLGDPSTFACPYPRAPDAARTLRCGWGDGGECDGPAEAVHVIALGTDDEASAALDAIAEAGGTGAAHRATSANLRAQLAAVIDGILE